MNRLLHCVAGVLLFGALAADGRAGDNWETDFDKASAAAKASNRYLLLDFTGSDWCGWCIRLDKEVFGEKAFEEYAEKNLICVLLDFPQQKALKASLKEQNESLMQKFGVRGFPTVIVLAPDGSVVGRTGYQKGGPENYVEHLKSFIDPHRKQNRIPEPSDPAAPRTTRGLDAIAKRKAAVNALPRDETRAVRTWKSASGTEISASLLEERGTTVRLRKEDGSLVEIPMAQLSTADREYIAKLKTSAPKATGSPGPE